MAAGKMRILRNKRNKPGAMPAQKLLIKLIKPPFPRNACSKTAD
jgi:hypothetical protein